MLPAFVLLATLNAGGYRYGASDQAFYLPAILKNLDAELYPRDTALIGSQARLTLVDETIATAAGVSGLGLPALFALLYLASLALLAWAAIGLGRELFTAPAAAVAFLFALTLRHAITKTGTNTLEGYFHPRQLAFAFGALSIASYVRHGLGWVPLLLGAAAIVVHPTTAVWFLIWLGVAVFVAEKRLRRTVAAAGAVAAALGVWALVGRPRYRRQKPK